MKWQEYQVLKQFKQKFKHGLLDCVSKAKPSKERGFEGSRLQAEEQ